MIEIGVVKINHSLHSFSLNLPLLRWSKFASLRADPRHQESMKVRQK